MGLTKSSTGEKAIDTGLIIKKRENSDKVVALAGNPNVGKSTVFNALTGLNQHTGNWPGKTVANAQGYSRTQKNSYVLVDIPGTYSLMAHSAEEEIARSFICFGDCDAVIIVCDATCLERNLNLVLQILETNKRAILCLNLLDEAKRKGIKIDGDILSERLGIKVVGTVAHNKKSLKYLLQAIDNSFLETNNSYKVKYNEDIEYAISRILPYAKEVSDNKLDARWLSVKLLDMDDSLKEELYKYLGTDIYENESLLNSINEAISYLEEKGYDKDRLRDSIVSSIFKDAEEIARKATKSTKEKYTHRDERLDKILTSKKFGYPIMVLLLLFTFYITLEGANYPSGWLSHLFNKGESLLFNLFNFLHAPRWLSGILIEGMYRVLSWVVAVMLPPMAIFFPLFTLLEDSGYLPRIAYNLDKPFKKCSACGKQALTMCMGFGCNAAGVVGARIIDSPRERLLAIITNNFVPCNGRFPSLIALITIFFVGAGGFLGSIKSAFFLTGFVLLGVLLTFLSTKLLSKTLLRGTPSSFVLELPPYRRPQYIRVIARSFLDRTFFVLLRAIKVAAPAGILIWLLANTFLGDKSLLLHISNFLDPFAGLIGLDGIILTAFILGFPANEIVIPIMIMAYTSNGVLSSVDISEIKTVLIQNGWSIKTALCTIIFFLMHWPCSTTLITIKKETGSVRWTLVSFLLPTLIGFSLCFLINLIFP